MNQFLIQELIRSKKENEFFDVKMQWHSEKGDLVKDIICFSNTTHDNDCYIIFGITDSFEIVGVSGKRYRQADVIDLLSKLDFANNERPNISVDTIKLEGKEIDVLTVYNTDNTPLFLLKQYGKMKAGCVYAREKDRNTPDLENANFSTIESLWKKRFGLTKNKKDYFFKILEDIVKWEFHTLDSIMEFYYSISPEYRIVISESDDRDARIHEFYAYKYISSIAKYSSIKFFYKNIEIERLLGVWLDDFQQFIPIPDVESIGDIIEPEATFGYYLKDGYKYKLLLLLSRVVKYSQSHYDTLFSVIFLFSDAKEKDDFVGYVKKNMDQFRKKVQNVDDFRRVPREEARKNLKSSKVLFEMYDLWRNKSHSLR